MQDVDRRKKISAVGFNRSQPLSHAKNKEKTEMREENESHDGDAPYGCRLRLCVITNAFGFRNVHGLGQPNLSPACFRPSLDMYFGPLL